MPEEQIPPEDGEPTGTMPEAQRIDIAEFREVGYLQELNRRFLHPLGLAMEVVVEDDGSERLGGVWDYRADPEGIYYGGDKPEAEKALMIDQLWEERIPRRRAILGFAIQPFIPTPRRQFVEGNERTPGAADSESEMVSADVLAAIHVRARRWERERVIEELRNAPDTLGEADRRAQGWRAAIDRIERMELPEVTTPLVVLSLPEAEALDAAVAGDQFDTDLINSAQDKIRAVSAPVPRVDDDEWTSPGARDD